MKTTALFSLILCTLGLGSLTSYSHDPVRVVHDAVIYDAPVVYQQPVTYHAPVYYLGPVNYWPVAINPGGGPTFYLPVFDAAWLSALCHSHHSSSVIYFGGPRSEWQEQHCPSPAVIYFGRLEAQARGYRFNTRR